MIKVEAVVRPEKVNQVLNALQEAGCGGFHYGNVTGQGKQQGVEVFTGRGGQLVNRSAMPKTVITTVDDGGATAHLRYATTTGIITAYNSVGSFTPGEKLIFNGIDDNRIATAITAY